MSIRIMKVCAGLLGVLLGFCISSTARAECRFLSLEQRPFEVSMTFGRNQLAELSRLTTEHPCRYVLSYSPTGTERTGLCHLVACEGAGKGSLSFDRDDSIPTHLEELADEVILAVEDPERAAPSVLSHVECGRMYDRGSEIRIASDASRLEALSSAFSSEDHRTIRTLADWSSRFAITLHGEHGWSRSASLGNVLLARRLEREGVSFVDPSANAALLLDN